MFPPFPAFLVLIASFGSSLSAELPEVPGVKIVRDLSVGSAKFVHYLSSNISYTTATHALITVHGKGRDAYNTFTAAQAGVSAAVKEGLVKNGSVVIAAPVFFNGASPSGQAADRALTACASQVTTKESSPLTSWYGKVLFFSNRKPSPS
jgi:hypothetical protein